MRSAWLWFVSVFDGLSQLTGRLIFIRNQGQWRVYTDTANESISGASYRYHITGQFSWPKHLIDLIFRYVFFDPDHCYRSWINDYTRAKAYAAVVESYGETLL